MRKEYDRKILKVIRELDKFHFDQTYTTVLQRISSSEPEYESFLLDCNEVTIGTPGKLITTTNNEHKSMDECSIVFA
jgi:hypothetical protein